MIKKQNNYKNKPELYNSDYYDNGVARGISCYENYRWLPDLTFPMAYSIVDFLKLSKDSIVLDYGCAHGFLVKALNLFGINAFGFEISKYAVTNCDPLIKKKIKLIRNNNIITIFKKLKLNRKFDLVIAKDVFEHISPNELSKVLKQLSKISKKMIVIVPLGDNSKYRIKSYHLDVTHIIAEDEKYWLKLFKDNGFILTEFSYNIKGVKDKWYKVDKKGNGFFLLESKK